MSDASSPAEQQTDALAEAATVAIVLHGVGDHSAVDVLGHAEDGLKAAFSGKVEASQIELRDMPYPGSNWGGDEGNQLALRIREGERTHLVLPLIWSGLRPRAYDQAEAFTFRSPIQSLFLAFPAVFQTAFRLLLCVVRVRRLVYAPLILLTATFFAAGAALLLTLVLYLFSNLPWWLRDPQGKLHWYSIIAYVSISAAVLIVVRKYKVVVDFIGDVGFYVGKKSHRHYAEQVLRDVLAEVLQRSPNSRILVVGHSLGSVLVTHSLLDLSLDNSQTDRIIVLTLGSPLSMMHRFFRNVRSPQHIASQFSQQGLPVFWANMWRDSDVIGNGLDIDNAAFGEVSLGIGVHSDYWSDKRLWQSIVSLLNAAQDGSVEQLRHSWSHQPLTNAEKTDTALLPTVLTKGLVFYGLVWIGCSWLFYWMPNEAWFSDAPIALQGAYVGLVGLVWILALGICCIAARSLVSKKQSPRSALRRFRVAGYLCKAFEARLRQIAILFLLVWLLDMLIDMVT